MMERPSEILKQILMMFAGILVGIGLYLASLYNYLLFHGIAELTSIAVAYGVFMIAWNSRGFNQSRYTMFLGIAYLFIGSLDLVHTLAYKGMNIFPGYDADLPTQLWIQARYLESLSLLTALRFLKRPLHVEKTFGVYSAITLILTATAFAGVFPSCYREGSGLTTFKIVSEYLIVLILSFALVRLLQQRAAFSPSLLRLMAASLVLTICSELAFTFYISVYGLSNLIGHYFKLLSFYLIYKAVIETGLRDPYSLLFRDVQESHVRLQESEARFRRLAENAPEIIYRYDLRPEPHFEYVSPAATAITGYTPEEHYADPYLGFKFIHPDDRESLQNYTAPGREFTQPRGIELRWIRKDGQIIWTEQRIMPLYDETGNLIALEGIARDVTARKQAEEALRQSEQKYRTLAESIPGMVHQFILHPDGSTSVPYINERIAEYAGVSAQAVTAEPALLFAPVHPEDQAMVQEAIAVSARALRDFCVEHRLIGPSGELRWFRVHSIPQQLPNGDILWNGVSIEITDQKRVEQALRENEIRYQKAQRLGQVGNWEYNIQTDKFWGSEEAKRIYGFDPQSEYFSAEEVEGCIPDRLRVHQALLDLLEKDQEYNLEFDILTHDTQERKVIVSLAELERDAQGRPLKVTGVIQDVTDRKRAEAQIKAALKEKEVLLREIYHRVKNNLMVVTSLIEMQREQTTDPEALSLFRDLHNRVMAMSMVHEDLYQSQNLSQIEFGAYLERLLINIRQGFSKTEAAITIDAKGILLDVHKAIPCGLIVAELVTNAFKYAFPTPPQPSPKGREELPLLRRGPGGGPAIRVEMHKSDNAYTLIVSDNGVGLPPEFDIQTSKTLGMTLVRSWAAHQLKGNIDIDSQPGTTFRITFT